MNGAPAADFAAVVLAGGRSTRMGAEKASLRLPDGRTLLARQLDLLAELHPTGLFVSARSGQTLPPLPPGVRRIDDDGTAGPLGGIVAVLLAATHPRLLVVAVDLPHLDAPTLRRLLRGPGGAVPRAAGRLEPLVAVYPRSFAPLAEAALARGEPGLQRLLAAPEAAGLFSIVPMEDARPFFNWNHPQDGCGV